jgi:glycosyltransferase involved in cell wall biosynthesis
MPDTQKPTVSVVIPTYNRGFCIAQALESVFRQTYKDYEVIVVDDGSTDNTKQVLAGYGQGIKAIHQQNSGASAARNAGIAAATGDWIAFLDSDDEWFPDKLAVQMADVNENPTVIAHIVDAVISDQAQAHETLFSLRGVLGTYAQMPFRQRPLLDVLQTQFFTPCWLLKKTAIQSAGYFNTALHIFEDIDLLTRIALQGPLFVNTYVGTNVLRKSEGADSLSDLYQRSRQESLGNLIAMHKRLLLNPTLTGQEIEYIKKELAANYIEMALARGRTKKHWNYYVRDAWDQGV